MSDEYEGLSLATLKEIKAHWESEARLSAIYGYGADKDANLVRDKLMAVEVAISRNMAKAA